MNAAPTHSLAPAAPAPGRALLARSVRRHALGWLVAANAVGLWLAACLLWPALGDAAAPLTYGRWAPLHLDWQLYGWCALPLAGVLIGYCLPSPAADPAPARGALGLWSVALAVGGGSWLAGHASGKLFLDWRGGPRMFFPFALACLWVALLAQVAGGARTGRFRGAALAGRAGLLALLAGVPAVLYWSAGRTVYPAVDPHSGGATGTSLLASTLGIVAVFGLLPLLLGVAPRADRRAGRRWFWGCLALSGLVCAGLNHGHASHHAPGQILGLGLLLAWVPLRWHYLRGFAWSPGSRPWLRAADAWWLLLVAQGFFIFLPGISERLKFTHALVSHAHLAMAGLLTSVNFSMLEELAPGLAPQSRRAFWRWQVGCALHVAALFALGWFEAGAPAVVFLAAPAAQVVFAVRLAAGGLMGAASLEWLVAAWRPAAEARA